MGHHTAPLSCMFKSKVITVNKESLVSYKFLCFANDHNITHLQTKDTGANLLLKFMLVDIPKVLVPFSLRQGKMNEKLKH